MTVEIKLRRKYVTVTHGRYGGSSHTGTKKDRLPRSQADKERAAAQKKLPSMVMHIGPDGKRRMRRGLG